MLYRNVAYSHQFAPQVIVDRVGVQDRDLAAQQHYQHDEWLGPSSMYKANVPGHSAERYRLSEVQVESVPVDATLEEHPGVKAIVDYFEGLIFANIANSV